MPTSPAAPSDASPPRAPTTAFALLPLFRFTLRTPDSLSTVTAGRYHSQREADFRRRIDNRYLTLTARESNVPADSLVMLDKRYARELMAEPASWELLFQRGITQTLIKQYTNAVGTFTSAIDQYPANPFLYLNRSTTRAEMIDFISSIDNSYQRITIESDPAKRLQNSQSRTYNYDEAIADLNKAAKLYPDFPYTYYNRANLMALSGKLPEAYNDYTKAIELNPAFCRSVLQPRAGTDLHEGHAQGLSRHVESRRTGYSGGLRNPETIHRTRPMIRSTHSITAPTAPATAVGRVHTLHNGDAAETVLRKLSPKFNNQ